MATIKRGQSARTKYKTPKVTKPRGFKAPQVNNLTYAEYLASRSQFGGTQLERLVDGAAAEIGRAFDSAQKYIPLASWYEKTVADRWINNPPTSIFIDGMQHDLRTDTAQGDLLKRMQLEAMGIKVVSLHWSDLLRDPIGTVGLCFFL